MSFSNNRFLKKERRKKNINATGGFYDTINFILGIGVIVSAFIIFIDHIKYEKIYTIVFLMASIMNFCMGIKYFKRSEMLKTAALMIAGVFLMAMAVITFTAFW